MKKKIVAILLVVVSMSCALSLSGCQSCADILLTPPKPTEKSVCETAADWDIELPSDLKLLNYSIDLGINDGTCFYELEYNGNNETFNSLLSSEKNEFVEKSFANIKFSYNNGAFQRCTKDCKHPDMSKTYLWLMKYKNPYDRPYSDDESFSRLFIAYLPEINALYILKNIV